MKDMTLQVEGMSCQHCVNAIEKTLKELGATGKVDLQHNTVNVSYNESVITIERIQQAIAEQGYDVL